MTRLLSLSVRHPRIVVALAAAITLIAASLVPRVRVRLDGRALVPADHESMRQSDAAAAVFALRDLVVVGVRRDDGIYTVDGIRRLAAVGDALARCYGIAAQSVASLVTVPRLIVSGGTLDLQPLAARAPSIDAALVDRVRAETRYQGLDDGVLVSSDGRMAAIYAGIEPLADRRELHDCVDRAVRPDASTFVSGSALAQAVLGEAAVADLSRLLPLVIGIVGAVLVLLFGRALPAVVSLTEVAATLVWTAGLLGLFRQQVFVTTLSLPVIVLVIGVSDDLYALNHYFAERRRQRGQSVAAIVLSAFGDIRRPVTVTAVTTAFGLLSLATTSLEPLRVFGVFGACAVMISTLFTMTLVPALLVLTDAAGTPAALPGQALAGRAVSALSRTIERGGRRRLFTITAAVALAAAVIGTRVRVEDNWVSNLPPSSDVAAGDRAINAALAGTSTIEVMLEAAPGRDYRDPEELAALARVEDTLRTHPYVGAVLGPYTDVVRATAALHERPYHEYREQLARGDTRLSATEAEQAVLLLESLRGSPLPMRLDRGARRARVTVFVRAANYSRSGAVLGAIHDAARAARGREWAVVPFGDGWIGYNTIRLIVTGQVSSIAFALVSDTLAVALLLGSAAAAALAMLPVVCAIALLFAALALTGTPIGTATSMFAAIALGIGADYSIHLVTACQTRMAAGARGADAVRAALSATGPAILMSAVALPAGFLVLAMSAVRPNRQLGMLIAAGMSVSALLTLALVPPLASLLTRRSPLPRRGTDDGEQRDLGSEAVRADGADEPA